MKILEETALNEKSGVKSVWEEVEPGKHSGNKEENWENGMSVEPRKNTARDSRVQLSQEAEKH